jgi:hypothetical protein
MLSTARMARVAGQDDLGSLLCEQRLGDHAGIGKTISVRLADTEGHRNQASILVNKMYGWRGYGVDHDLAADENKVTFTAWADRQPVGTLTLGVDSPDGLAADATFKNELDAFRRRPGVKLCELTKFACDPREKSQAALAALFHVIFIYGTCAYGGTDLVIEVHPRHVKFYEAMLGFERIGAPKLNPDIEWWPSDVPVQLMWLKVSEIRRFINEHAGRRFAGKRSLYPYFFSPSEERGIWSRVAALAAGIRSGREVGHFQAPIGQDEQRRAMIAAA